jgi:phosphate transport system permease protein
VTLCAKKFRPRWILWSCALGVVVTLAALFATSLLLLWQSLPVFFHSGTDLLAGREWYYPEQVFGALSMIYGTAVVSVIALLLAVPLAVGTAVLSAEYLPPALRLAVKSGIELLAGVPSVVYGLIGVLFLREWVYLGLEPFEPISGDSLLTAGLLLAVMILPTITTLCDDALRSVPAAQRAAARGLGLTRAEAILHVALPQAAPGILAAALLGLGRALGETVAVFLVVGRQDNQLPGNPFSLTAWISPGQTLASKLGGPETHLAYGDPLHWSAIIGLALLLLLLVGICLSGAWGLERVMKQTVGVKP